MATLSFKVIHYL